MLSRAYHCLPIGTQEPLVLTIFLFTTSTEQTSKQKLTESVGWVDEMVDVALENCPDTDTGSNG